MAEETSMGSVRDNAAAPDAPGHPRRRTGCSCWTILLFLVFLALVIGGGAYLGIKSLIEKMSLAHLTAAERVEYQTWMDTPVTLPAQWHTIHATPPSAKMQAERDAVVKEMQLLMRTLTQATTATETIYKNLDDNTPISEADARTIMNAAAPHLDLFHRMASLAAQPNYTLTEPLKISGYPFPRLHPGVIISVTLADHQLGQSQQALDRVDAFIRYLRMQPPQFSDTTQFQNHYIGIVLKLCQYMALDDTDGAVCARALTVLNDNATSTLEPILQGSLSEIELLSFYLMEHKHPITQKGNFTLRQAHHLLHAPHWITGANPRAEVYTWLEHQLPPADPDRAEFHALASNYARWHTATPGSTWQQIVYDIIGDKAYQHVATTLKVAARAPLAGIDVWKNAHDANARNKRMATQYHLTRLFLARRVAELRGDPLPVTQSDFVPRYLPEWPADPFSATGAGFQFDATTGEFYSIGPDATPATLDDITMEKLPAPTAAETTDTSDTITATESLP